MRLTNHIAKRFLTDDTLAYEMIERTHPQAIKKILNNQQIESVEDSKVRQLWRLINKNNQKAYLITETVHDKLDMLKVKLDAQQHYDWTVFNQVKECKKTFILMPDENWKGGGCLRILVHDDYIEFCHICFRFKNNDKNNGECLWTLFFINRKNNEHAEHCSHKNVTDIYEFVYKLLCFIFLSENEYQEVKGGQSVGTKKNGKFKNDLPISVTIINSKWNITVVRTEGFMVRGHFALRRCGEGRQLTKMVYIEPFQKHGYIRKAGKQLDA